MKTMFLAACAAPSLTAAVVAIAGTGVTQSTVAGDDTWPRHRWRPR
jgi:hypothetical protein